ncbi:non-ribosomal peptide synthetase, partial [Paenibacillus turpanensis]|uniref:non-ribosomal peptide synthetase n=1 Tax=Paenibacillus turpanensis TaxID=2689078 RepID=UPI00140D0C22
IPEFMAVEGPLEFDRLKSALQQLCDRHETLRTGFELRNGEPVQIVRDTMELDITTLECTEEELPRMMEELVQPFDLAKAPLFRAAVIRTGEERYVLFTDMHHIISDAVSMGVFIEEFRKLYAGEPLEPLRVQYRDYAVWQQKYAESEAFREHERYWLEQLSGELPVLELPTDYPRPAFQTFEGARWNAELPAETLASLRRIAQQTGSTLYMVFLAAYKLLLSRYTGQQEILVGSPIAGRTQDDLHALIGMFVNTLVIRTELSEEESFTQLLLRVKDSTLRAGEHQEYPFELLIEKLDMSRDVSRNPVFDTMFDFQYKPNQELSLDQVRITPLMLESPTSKFDLSLDVLEEEEGITLSFEYSTRLFRRETVEQLSEHYMKLLSSIADEPDAPLAEISLLREDERTRMTVDWNTCRAAAVEPVCGTFHEWFEVQAERTPNHAAIRYGSNQMSYAELNAKANRLAHQLIEHGVAANAAVAIMTERSLDMIVGVLAILKAGGAFVPIDPNYPQERIQFMLDDCGSKWLVTHRQLQQRVVFSGVVVELDLDLDHLAESVEMLDKAKDNPRTTVQPGDLAYMIYTSGTTGKPKGVMIEHQSWMQASAAWITEYRLQTMPVRLLQMASFAFDVFAGDLSRALLNGGHLVICPEDVKLNPPSLYDLLQQNRITLFESTPALVVPLMQYIAEERLPVDHLELLILGSDSCSKEDFVFLMEQFGSRMRILNSYGVTEACIDSSYYEATTIDELTTTTVPIGKPLQHASFYVLDRLHRLQPAGVYGELYIGGKGVARGYHGRPELTAERFIPNPFVAGERLYRTGDVVRWLPDGNLIFAGRSDRQVKINGYRIELGEIEAVLLKQPMVRECAVVDRTELSGSKTLCAYVVMDQAAALDAKELKESLLRELPGYMVPAHVVQLDKLPLTPNGKIDRTRLPVLQAPATDDSAYVEPTGEVEGLLSEIWSELLGVPRVGRQHHFFDLGGDSIKAIQLASRLRKHGLTLDISKLFLYPTLEQLAVHVKQAAVVIPQEPVEGNVRLTPIQNEFFTFDDKELHHYNQSVVLECSSERLVPLHIQTAMSRLVEHHDALRMVFFQEDGQWKQRNRPLLRSEEEAFHFYEFDLLEEKESQDKVTKELDRLQGSFSLEHGPLVTVALFHAPDRDYLAMIVHHLVVDGVSWRILLEDFDTAYTQAKQGLPVQLQEKTTSLQDWAEKLHGLAADGAFDRELSHWKAIENAAAGQLPKEAAAQLQPTAASTAWESVEWTEEQTKQLMTEAHKPYNTDINDILLAALGMALSEWCKSEQIAISLESHGRESIIKDADVSRTVGWFTSQYPVLLTLPSQVDLGYQIKSVKEQLRAVPGKGIGYGWLKLTGRGLSAAWQPEISFNYFGEFTAGGSDGKFEISSVSSGHEIGAERKREFALDINGAVTDHKLQFSFSYSTQEFTSEKIRSLADAFKAKLLDLINHCCAKTERELTPSDLGTNNELSIDELHDLSSLVASKIKL